MTAAAKPFPMHEREFVALMASIMALNALAIDAMLPAFPAIRESLNVADPNSLQYMITAYMLANAVGSLVAGPLADRFGRRPMLLLSITFSAIGGLASALASTYEMLLTMRAIHGFFAAGLGVLAVSVIRDRFSGDTMARLMSVIFIIFMLVPVIAPSMGQLVLIVASWREIFLVLAVCAAVVLTWTWRRLPETLDEEQRQRISIPVIARNWLAVVKDRQGLGYMLGAGVMMGGMFGFLNSAQQIFFDVFDAGTFFPLAFACVAGSMAVANFSNSRIVERFGARRVSHTALLFFIAVSLAQLVASQMHPEPLLLFMVLIALNMGMVGFTGSNFGSIAMEPFGHIAGSAASFQSFARMAIATLIGAATGQRFDGTTQPLAEGFMFTGLIGLGFILWAERGRLFTRPRRNAMRPPLPPR
ncbi:MAG: multidrug effflux MFS transporter [Alphaproteobacteria bacterium]|nr:multidrug effflux MFS transporter [Alphaproteobacteria bacterium]MBU0794761.1 multidrug effflux MFS transporter [Alphaproteobacteria bacterium]MBU0874338.1 multidrug effflux MFS transporter [Alphaproteobacteria bacterium]MBU1769670.1 multidrug effflux MFS transporter [Alphaproteobacteria bacterium]